MSHPLIVTAMLFVLARARHGHAPQNRSFSPLGTQNAQIAREWTAAARDPERMMSMLERGGEPPPLGRALRAYFPVQDNMILFNTCREGHPPIPVLDAVRGYDVAWDTERFEVDEALFRRVKASLSNLVGTGPQNIRLIPSVAVGVATVIRSLRVPKDKKILYLSSEFYVCTDILRRLEELSGRELLLEVKISPPFSANRVVKSVRAALESNPNGISHKTKSTHTHSFRNRCCATRVHFSIAAHTSTACLSPAVFFVHLTQRTTQIHRDRYIRGIFLQPHENSRNDSPGQTYHENAPRSRVTGNC